MADKKISDLSDGGAPQDTDELVIARAGSNLSLLFSAIKAAIPGGVSSVFSRTGAVTAQSGDYTAAQVGALPSTETLDQIATANATAASVAMNTHKLTGLAAGTTNGDSVRYEQIPTALPPNGTAGGDLGGSYPNPTVAKITETSGPTDLTIGTVADGQFLKRSGSTLVSGAVMTNPLTTKGDIVIEDASPAPARLAIGATGQDLQVVSGLPAWGYPPGYEFDYVQRTTDLTVTASVQASAQTLLTGNAVSFDGSTRVKIEVWCTGEMGTTAGNQLILDLWDGSTDLGNWVLLTVGSTTTVDLVMYGVFFVTPTNASHTYTVKAWRFGANGKIYGSLGYPAWYRITKA